MKSETQGFISIFPGYKSFKTDPCNGYHLTEKSAPAYYIDGSKIPKRTFCITLTNQFMDGVSVPQEPITYRIRLLSIPEEMYLMMKSLYT